MSLMDIEVARKGYQDHSGRASDIARQLGFAGIALIWIFRSGSNATGFDLPPELLRPALFIVVTLACDFLQYVSGAIAWGVYSRWKEQQPEIRSDPTTSFEAPAKLNWAGNTFFFIKLVAIFVAYAFLLSYLLRQFA